MFAPTNASLVRSITTCLSPSNLCRGVSLLSTGRANPTFQVLISGRKFDENRLQTEKKKGFPTSREEEIWFIILSRSQEPGILGLYL